MIGTDNLNVNKIIMLFVTNKYKMKELAKSRKFKNSKELKIIRSNV